MSRRPRPRPRNWASSIVKGNVGSFDDCARAVKEIEDQLGPIDVLVNNAGITRDGFFHKMTHDQWSDVIRVNMDSVFNMTRQVINGMRDRGFGRIVNISSINGQKGQIGQTNYSAAKAGMIGFTKALALENARKGVTVNCIAPGYIDTEMVGAMDEKVLAGIIAQIPVGPSGQGRGDRRHGVLAVRRACRICHRLHPVAERRSVSWSAEGPSVRSEKRRGQPHYLAS